MSFDPEALKAQIPHYLTSKDQNELLQSLAALQKGKNTKLFLSRHEDSFQNSMLQGDGWRGLELFEFTSGEKISCRGIILSNSCDSDPSNPRDFPTKITFAPLLKVSKLRELYHRNGVKQDSVKNKLNDIRAQKVSSMFYLPAEGTLSEDYVVQLDNLHSFPASAHIKNQEREKLFTLSMTGFYLFVLKLSVHFCRLQENIKR